MQISGFYAVGEMAALPDVLAIIPVRGLRALFARRGLEPQPCGVLVFAGNFDFLSADVDPEGWYSPTLLAGGFKVFFISAHVRNADLRGVAGYPDAPETENLKRERRPLEAGAPASPFGVIPVFQV